MGLARLGKRGGSSCPGESQAASRGRSSCKRGRYASTAGSMGTRPKSFNLTDGRAGLIINDRATIPLVDEAEKGGYGAKLGRK